MTGANTVLKIKDATMQFGGAVAVDNLIMEVYEGEIVALIGPNGAGKTTAFNMITGVYPPTNGRILFNGKRIIESHPTGRMRRLYAGQRAGEFTEIRLPTPDKITAMGIARTFQDIRLWPSRTVFENVLIAKHVRRTGNVFSAMFRRNRDEEAAHRQEVLQLLRVVGLADVKDELATSLTFGMQRRLEIARALATNPSLLLLDEPAAGMSPQEIRELAEFIRAVRTELHKTILLIEHHRDLVMDIADRIYVMDFGRLVAQGTPEEIQSDKSVLDALWGVSDGAENT